MAKKNANAAGEACAPDAPDAPGFEALLAEAESLAEKMEEGGLSLDESIRAYEKGVEDLRRCADLLRAAEEKVQTLLEKNGAFRLEELDADPDEDGDGDDDGDEDGE
ncbi:MAG: exodeoxyribonuclease VII small subunit [Planctomycetota bacterium]|jgi:exodeoxyribonuclease VII small subunit|nr:exodeoxyribonuclease VII small subunit [Planctomycetota bacterium]